ncbi:hypothetical protein BKA62DRAFT_723943 [Auriculariales sp. MPI-PUGE-AT-0066]|nr:hypothetical protein BKA62DRAFT_723943 [Auriculariales sp. MPI-PUGE-AT-0066]
MIFQNFPAFVIFVLGKAILAWLPGGILSYSQHAVTCIDRVRRAFGLKTVAHMQMRNWNEVRRWPSQCGTHAPMGNQVAIDHVFLTYKIRQFGKDGAILSIACIAANVYAAATHALPFTGSFENALRQLFSPWHAEPVAPMIQLMDVRTTLGIALVANLVALIHCCILIMERIPDTDEKTASHWTDPKDEDESLEFSPDIGSAHQVGALLQIILPPCLHLFSLVFIPLASRSVGQTYQRNLDLATELTALIAPPLVGAMLYARATRLSDYENLLAAESEEPMDASSTSLVGHWSDTKVALTPDMSV